jgi:hypothetical protein
MIAEELLAAFEKRFWAKVQKTDGCWNWVGGGSKGRGQIGLNDRVYLAYRISWELAYGTAPGKLWILHKCDNPACVRPDHLFLGTNRDNIDDSMSKGHRRGAIIAASGENHGNSKLTWRDIDYILASSLGPVHIARELGVSYKTIKNIRDGKSWMKRPARA